MLSSVRPSPSNEPGGEGGDPGLRQAQFLGQIAGPSNASRDGPEHLGLDGRECALRRFDFLVRF
jgi:hypothetical protein